MGTVLLTINKKDKRIEGLHSLSLSEGLNVTGAVENSGPNYGSR